MTGDIKLCFISAACFFLWVHTYKDKNAFSFVTQQTLLILWSVISTLWHILHPQELGPSNTMNYFFFLKEHSSTWKIPTLENIMHRLISEGTFGPWAHSFSHCGHRDFWVQSQNLRILVCNSLSLNSEFATGVMQFHLNTDLPASRRLSARTEAQGHCWDAKGRTGRNWGNRCWLWYHS